MGFAGSVRLGWKARCMDCASVMTADAFSSSLLRRHAAFGFRFLSAGVKQQVSVSLNKETEDVDIIHLHPLCDAEGFSVLEKLLENTS